MALQDGYSRLIAWLKVALPLAALALLSTLFLLSRTTETDPELPFSDVDLKDRIDEQRVTGPYFAGTTANGAALTISARAARPDLDRPGGASAEEVEANFKLTDGSRIEMQAARAQIDRDEAQLSGSVRLESSTGYIVETERLRSGLTEMRAESEGEVRGQGPAGRFTAGKLEMTSDPDTGDVHLLFTNGIELVYEPKNREPK